MKKRIKKRGSSDLEVLSEALQKLTALSNGQKGMVMPWNGLECLLVSCLPKHLYEWIHIDRMICGHVACECGHTNCSWDTQLILLLLLLLAHQKRRDRRICILFAERIAGCMLQTALIGSESDSDFRIGLQTVKHTHTMSEWPLHGLESTWSGRILIILIMNRSLNEHFVKQMPSGPQISRKKMIIAINKRSTDGQKIGPESVPVKCVCCVWFN